MNNAHRKYLISGKEVTKEEFTKELLYQLHLEKRQNISHGVFTQEQLIDMVLNNKQHTTFFEVGSVTFKCYPVGE